METAVSSTRYQIARAFGEIDDMTSTFSENETRVTRPGHSLCSHQSRACRSRRQAWPFSPKPIRKYNGWRCRRRNQLSSPVAQAMMKEVTLLRSRLSVAAAGPVTLTPLPRPSILAHKQKAHVIIYRPIKIRPIVEATHQIAPMALESPCRPSKI